MSCHAVQYFGGIHQGLSVWYDPETVRLKKKLDVLYYKTLRIAMMDWRRIFPNEMLDLLEREKPSVFSSYATGSVYLNTKLTWRPKVLLEITNASSYIIRRTGKQRYFDSPSKIMGKQSLSNKIDDTTGHLTDLKTKDAIRIYLKKIFLQKK